MPTVSVNKELLFKSLNQNYSDKEFDELCFQFGLEVDDIVDEKDGSTSYKIEVGANRYDLLCLEGISRAINIYLGKCQSPKYSLSATPQNQQQKIIVKPSTAQIRPFVVGAVLRNVTFTPAVYDSFIALQDKLHQNIARKRTLVAIGTHDLSKIKGPFVYNALPPTDISFVPLNETKSFRADHLMEHFMSNIQMKQYVPIIKDSPVYPVITDASGCVLSLPPIINGCHSKITLATRDVFVECTATDKFKAQIVLDTVVCMFSQYCKVPFVIEPVQVHYEASGSVEQYPVLEHKPMQCSVAYVNSLVGVSESSQDMAQKLRLMGLDVSPSGPDHVDVVVPPTRYDVLHACDIAEDLAVAYGFDRLCADAVVPPICTIGGQLSINHFTEKLRVICSQNAYTEAATFALCSKADLGEKLRRDLASENVVEVGNPKTVDCEAVRNTLLPGVLRTIQANTHISKPLKIFEISDVSVKEPIAAKSRGTGVRNQRHLLAVCFNVKADMDTVHALLDNLMLKLKVPFQEEGQKTGYRLQPDDHPTFMPGYCARVMVDGLPMGRLGMLHPEVCRGFGLNCPATALEVNVQELLGLVDQPF